MHKPDTVESPKGKEIADPPASRQLRPGKHGTGGFAMVAWMKRFRQLDWADRLNLILATILGCALLLALSPLFLLSWICMQFAKHGLGFKRPGQLGADRQT